MMGLEVTGFEALFKDENFQAGLKRYQQGVDQMNQATDRGVGITGALGQAMEGALVTGLGVATAAVGAFSAAVAIGFEQTRKWAQGLDTLIDELGMTGEQASAYATAMGMAGVGVEEGSGGLNYFIRQLGSAQDAFTQAGQQAGEAMKDLNESNADALAKLADQWTEQQRDAAEKIGDIWGELADKKASIEADAARAIAKVNQDLTEKLEEMAWQRNEDLEQFARDAEQIEKDSAKARRDAEKDAAKKNADLDRDMQLDMLSAVTDEDRAYIKAKYDGKRKAIEDEKKERLAEIEEQRKERVAELETKKKEATELYEHNRALAQREAEEQRQSIRANTQLQIDAAEKAAQKQVEVIEKALAKQKKAYEQAVKDQEKQYEKAKKKIGETEDKGTASNPLTKALKELGIEAFDAAGKIKPWQELMPQILDKFEKLPAGIDRSALAMQLFGRNGAKFLEFLIGAAGSLDQAKKNMEAWGLSMSTEQSDAFEAFGFSLNEMQLRLQGIWNTIGLQVLPVAQQLVDFINKQVLPAFLQFARDVAPLVRDVLSEIAKFAGLVVAALQGKEGWDKVAAALLDWGKKFWDWLTDPKVGVITQAGKQVSKITDDISAKLEKYWPVVWEGLKLWAGKFWNWVTDPKEGVLVTLVENMEKITTNMKTWANDPLTQARFNQIGVDIGSGVVKGIGDLFGGKDTGENLIKKLGTGLMNAAQNLADFISKVGSTIAGGIVEGIAKNFTDPDTAKKMGQTFADFFDQVIGIMVGPGGPMYQIIRRLWDYITKSLTDMMNMASGITDMARALQTWFNNVLRSLLGLPTTTGQGSPVSTQTGAGAPVNQYSSSRSQTYNYNLSVSGTMPTSTVISDFNIMRSLSGA